MAFFNMYKNSKFNDSKVKNFYLKILAYIPNSGNRTTGKRDVIAIGKASVNQKNDIRTTTYPHDAAL